LAIDTPDIPSCVLHELTQLRLPSRPDWVGAAVEHLRSQAVRSGACDETRAGKLMVALHEALTNAVIHGNLELSSELKERGDDSFAETLAARLVDPVLSSRQVDVAVDYDGERCRWLITDQGKGFDADRALTRAASDDPEVLLASGRGIVIMRSFLDDVRYDLGGRRLALTLLRPSGAEKRRHERYALRQPLRVAPVGEDGRVNWQAAQDAVSRDISAQGLSFFQQQLASSRRVLIALETGGELVYLPAEVRHCQALAGNAVEIGCRFTADPGTPSDDSGAALAAVHSAVADLLERLRLPAAVADERRGHTRLPFHQRIEVRAEGQPPQAGFARDLSRGGIAFLTTAPLPCEERLILLPQPAGPPLGLRARVVRCFRVQDGLYDVGAEFLSLQDRPHEP
jgi:anti-sigma regulatory factor (Ser/Thr protein kinase)